MSGSRDIRGMPQIAMALALVALIAGVTVVVLDEFKTEQVTTYNRTVNDTIYFSAIGTANYTTDSQLTYFVQLHNSTVKVSNSTHILVRNANFTVNTATGQVTLVAGGAMQKGWYNLTYDYDLGSAARNMYTDGITGITELSGWLDIIALIFAMGIMLALVLKAIDYRGGRQDY